MIVESEIELINFLLNNLANKSRNNIKALLKYEQVVVNGKVVKQFNYPLKKGDAVEIRTTRKSDEIEIVYEDKDFLAINKKAGMVSVAKTGLSAFSQVVEYAKKRDKHTKIYVLHRLDRDTSGVLIFAKSLHIKKVMQMNWNDLMKGRHYYALVAGRVPKEHGVIVSELKENSEYIVY